MVTMERLLCAIDTIGDVQGKIIKCFDSLYVSYTCETVIDPSLPPEKQRNTCDSVARIKRTTYKET